ncbi:unnamed protein product [Rhizopus stolonifer]
MTKSFIKKNIKRVAVIGGGPGGIAAARALYKENAFDIITVYDRNTQVGGTWVYDSNTDPPPPIPSTDALEVDFTLQAHKLHSPIYASLRANLPKSVMCYRDVAFNPKVPLFAHHQQVLDYLQTIVVSENLLPLFRFSTRVDRVEPQKDVWIVSTTDLTLGKQSDQEFDAVVIATGHYNVPYIPNIPGVDQLSRHTETVLVIGGGSSGLDIVRETSAVAHKVYQCIRTENEMSRQAEPRSNVEQVSLLKRFDGLTIEFADGKHVQDVDVVVFATGFLFSYPFLPFQKGNLIQKGQKVHQLSHYMFYKQNPTLSFLGLPIKVAPFPLMQRQATVVAKYWSNQVPMLPYEELEQETDDKKEIVFSMEQEYDYNNRLGAWAEGWIDRPLEEWKSDDAVTGQLSDEWKKLRKEAFSLRKVHLGY